MLVSIVLDSILYYVQLFHEVPILQYFTESTHCNTQLCKLEWPFPVNLSSKAEQVFLCQNFAFVQCANFFVWRKSVKFWHYHIWCLYLRSLCLFFWKLFLLFRKYGSVQLWGTRVSIITCISPLFPYVPLTPPLRVITVFINMLVFLLLQPTKKISARWISYQQDIKKCTNLQTSLQPDKGHGRLKSPCHKHLENCAEIYQKFLK